MQSGRAADSGTTGTTWLIRDADPEADAQSCLEIYAPFVSNSSVSFEERVPTVEEFRERIRATAAAYPWLVLVEAGRVAGYAYASQHRSRAAYRWAADVTVYIGPEHRGRGVGRGLYTELFERLRRQGIRTVCAGVTVPNEASVGLHRAMGFEPVGVYRRIGWKAGAWHDVIWLQLELVPATDTAPPEPTAPGAKTA